MSHACSSRIAVAKNHVCGLTANKPSKCFYGLRKVCARRVALNCHQDFQGGMRNTCSPMAPSVMGCLESKIFNPPSLTFPAGGHQTLASAEATVEFHVYRPLPIAFSLSPVAFTLAVSVFVPPTFPPPPLSRVHWTSSLPLHCRPSSGSWYLDPFRSAAPPRK